MGTTDVVAIQQLQDVVDEIVERIRPGGDR
jgi:hypothetical protein